MRIKINTHGNSVPETHGDWTDLATAEEIYLKKGEFALISLGVSMELPKDCFALVVPRSSTFKKWKILQTNSCGVIDNAYCGDNDIWKFPALATEDVHIPKNCRIAQFLVMKKGEPVSFELVDKLDNNDRGGFGSSGD